MRERIVVAAGFGLVGAMAACSAIIGTRDLTLAGSDSGSNPDGSPITTGDGSAPPVTETGAPVDGSGGNPGKDGATPDSSSTSCGSADLQTDQHNCGACGHDCLGGACAAAQCQAYALVPAQLGAAGIAVDATSVYWTTFVAGQVLKANKDGTGVTILATDTDGNPFDITLDATNVYWTDQGGTGGTGAGTVNTCPKSGASPRVQLTPDDLNTVGGLSVDPTHIYWAEGNSNDVVGVLNRSDGGIGYLVAGLFIGGPYEIAADDASVFFSTDYAVQKSPKNAPLAYGDPQTDDTLATDAASLTTYYSSDTTPTFAWGITLDDTNVYWTVQGSGLVQFASRTATGAITPTTLTSAEVVPTMIAVDATNVYWTASGPNSDTNPQDYPQYLDGYVATCPKAGCPSAGPTKLATKLVGPYGIAVDDTAIYFTQDGNIPNATTGSVWKIAK